MSTAAILGQLLSLKADKTFYTQQQIFWSEKYKSNSAKLAAMQNAEEKWNTEYDKATDGTRTSELKYVYNSKNCTIAKETAGTEKEATHYADYKAPTYDPDTLEILTEDDMEYDTMKTMYDTLLEEIDAEIDSLKQKLQEEAGDTHEVGGQ